ncbi:MAG: serine/threonine protein kinase [Bdellovibrionaceae bacterium]|nr:serine/threonine protein kinase [Bdellovibrionales bacterium]MCB9083233.1 serine/threonine protein kinase [Pseudobdellovibrionaceae bacterium]
MKDQRIDKYYLLESIGKGGMGEVYLARNPGAGGIGKFVAIKKLLKEYDLNQKRSKLFRREAEVTIKLNHSNIASIYEVGEHEGTLYLVMEYIPGITLKQVFERHLEGLMDLGVADAVHIAISVMSGLSYAQRFVDPITKMPSPVLHCDICPQNVLVSFEGELKIIDFGVAKVVGQETTTSQSDSIIGKVKYISPERAQDLTVDGRSDIYSVGIILWEMLSGQRYYDKDDFSIIRSYLLGTKPPKPLPPFVPMTEQLQPILDKMLANNPEDRYSSAEEAEAELRLFFNRNFPEYLPSKFRDSIQISFADEIIENSNLMAEYADATGKVTAQNQPAPSPIMTGKVEDFTLRQTDVPPTHLNPPQQKHRDEHLYSHINIVQGPPPKQINWQLIGVMATITLIAGYLTYTKPFARGLVKSVSSWFSQESRNPASTDRSDAAMDKIKEWAKPAKGIEVTIETMPSGADIILDGRRLYRQTPATISISPDRSYRLQLTKPGYNQHLELFSSKGGSHHVLLRPSGKTHR